MSRSRRPGGKRRSAAAGTPRRVSAVSSFSAGAAAEGVLWLLVLLVPLLLVPTARDPFRLPKLMVGEWLGLASLLPLALRVRGATLAAGWRPLLRHPALAAVLPILAVATATLATSEHPVHVRSALADLWIGAALLVAWSLALEARRLERLLAGLLVPAALLAALAALQFHGVFQPFGFVGISGAQRLGVTSLAGNPGDLGSFLALAVVTGLVAVLAPVPRPISGPDAAPRPRSRRAGGRITGWRIAGAVALALSLYGLALTQTLAAVAAVAAGGLVAAWFLLARRRMLVVAATAAALLAVAVAGVAPLRARLGEKVEALAAGEVNDLLTGRLDGWRAALWMATERPVAGVGHGAYAAEFVPAKQALVAEGVEFYRHHSHPFFANAHNDLLEAVAEWGVPGGLALAWALAVLVLALRRRAVSARQRALGWGGLAVLAVLALGHFPFHLGMLALPALLWLAWALRRPDAPAAENAREAAAAPARGGDPGRVLVWVLVPLLAVVLALHSVRLRDRLRASRIEKAVDAVSAMVARSGRVPSGLPWNHLRLLDEAEALAPTEAAVVDLMRGGQYLMLGRTDEAIAAYRRAIAFEPRPEAWFNLARAQLLDGDRAAALESYAVVLAVDRSLLGELPPGLGREVVAAARAAADPAAPEGSPAP